jgi:hypothetical protein
MGDLFFIHEFKDTFKYCCKDNNITVTRTDNNCVWGQKLIGYKDDVDPTKSIQEYISNNFNQDLLSIH